MEKKEFYFQSQDGKTLIHGIEWVPDEKPKAVLQICHGMVEYIERYDEFANFLASRGYYVVGHDHLGHGESVSSKTEYGYFHRTKGNAILQADIHKVRLRTQQRYPGLPYFLMGHSMGSFLVRQYIQKNSRGLSGVIIMGTGHQPALVLYVGIGLCRFLSKLKGGHFRSTKVNQMAFGGFNKRFMPARTSMDWLSRDEERVDAYLAHPWCNFTFTVNAYEHLFLGILKLSSKKENDAISRNLPIFFISGKDDPVGGFGKGVIKVYKKYKRMGMKQVCLRLYEKDRHELLNEIDRKRVMQDLYDWLEYTLDRSKSKDQRSR